MMKQVIEETSPTTMPRWSRYFGQPIDLSSRRSINLDAHLESEREITVETESVLVDDFYHAGQYWRALIPLDGISEIYGQAFNFSTVRTRTVNGKKESVRDTLGYPKYSNPLLNHIQVRVRFHEDQPIKLLEKDGRPDEPPAQIIDDMVYSIEVVGPAGVTFNLRDGVGGNLLAAHRFLSTEEMVFERLVIQNQPLLETPALPLSETDKRKLLVAALLRSHRAGSTERYFLYRFLRTNNCTSGAFSLLDGVVDYSWSQRIGSILYRLPIDPRMYLRVRGMDTDPKIRNWVREEFEEFITAPETQARKRVRVRELIAIKRAAQQAGGEKRLKSA